MAKQRKVIGVSITSLKPASEDKWLEEWFKLGGRDMSIHPIYLLLQGNKKPLRNWYKSRGLDYRKVITKVGDLLVDIINHGQNEPIKIYKNKVINTGHKRVSIYKYLKKDTILAEVVPDDYKL